MTVGLTMEERVDKLEASFAGHYWPDENMRAVFTAALSIERCDLDATKLDELVRGENERLNNRYPVIYSALCFLVNGECNEGLPDWTEVGSRWPLRPYWSQKRPWRHEQQ